MRRFVAFYVSARPLKNDIVEHEFIEFFGLFGEIPREKTHGVEFGVIEDVRLQKNGRGDVQPLANIREVAEKLRIDEFIVSFVCKLFYYLSVFEDFRPYSEHNIIIQNRGRIGNRFANYIDIAAQKS